MLNLLMFAIVLLVSNRTERSDGGNCLHTIPLQAIIFIVLTMVRMTSSEIRHFCFFLRHMCRIERSRAAEVMMDVVNPPSRPRRQLMTVIEASHVWFRCCFCSPWQVDDDAGAVPSRRASGRDDL